MLLVQIKSMLRRELGELDITALQRAPTIAQWTAMSEGVGGGGAMAGADVCMFRAVAGTRGAELAPIVFIHPAGGLCGPFTKLFAAFGNERDIWAIEHPYAHTPRLASSHTAPVRKRTRRARAI